MPSGGQNKIEYTEDIRDDIIDLVSEGNTIIDIAKMEGMPSAPTIYRWLAQDPVFADMLPRAREQGTAKWAEEALEIADNPDLDPADKRVRIDTRLRLIGKWNRAIYGDKVDHEYKGGVTINVIDSFPEPEIKTIEHE